MTTVERLAAALAVAFHEARWCKWSEPGHSVAHDDADEDRYRATLAEAIIDADPTLASDAEDGAELRLLKAALPEGWTLRVYSTRRTVTPVWSVSVHMPGTRADARSRAIGRGPTIAAAARAARAALEERR